MNYKYRLSKSIVTDEDGIKYTVYGIEAIDISGHILCSYKDVFFCKEEGKRFVKLCNRCKLELIHFTDVIEDAVSEYRMIYLHPNKKEPQV